MKVIGFHTSWGCSEWAVRSLYNHLRICDEILVSVQAHDEIMVPFGDDTYERIAIEFANDERVKIIPEVFGRGNINTVKCLILNEMLTYVAPGDVVMLCDADEFYDDNSIKEIQSEIDGDWDMLRVYDRFFCINMNYYVGGSHGRFWRIKSNAKFYPTQNLVPVPVNVKTILEDNPMFHYSMLQSMERRIAYWTSDSARDSVQIEWIKNIYNKWNPEGTLDEIRDMAEKNYQLTGNRGFWFNSGVREHETEYLFRYNGQHPEEIEFSNFRNKKDFRK